MEGQILKRWFRCNVEKRKRYCWNRENNIGLRQARTEESLRERDIDRSLYRVKQKRELELEKKMQCSGHTPIPALYKNRDS